MKPPTRAQLADIQMFADMVKFSLTVKRETTPNQRAVLAYVKHQLYLWGRAYPEIVDEAMKNAKVHTVESYRYKHMTQPLNTY